MSTTVHKIPEKVRLQVVADRRGNQTGIALSQGLIVVHLSRKRKRQLHKALPCHHHFSRFAFDEVCKEHFPGENLLTPRGMEKLNYWHPIRRPIICVEEDPGITTPEGFRVQSNEHRDILVFATPEKIKVFSQKAHELGLSTPADFVAHIVRMGVEALKTRTLDNDPQ